MSADARVDSVVTAACTDPHKLINYITVAQF